LTGIARLHRLRNDPKLAGVSAVWPFETGWAAKAKWLPVTSHIFINDLLSMRRIAVNIAKLPEILSR
jgi:hypothetical protein